MSITFRYVVNILLLVLSAAFFQLTAQATCLEGTSDTPQIEVNSAYTFVRFRLDELGRRRYCDEVGSVTEVASSSVGDGAGPLVVVFVHGWKHDGGANDEYIAKFRDFLSELAATQAGHELKWRRRVVGVYVSWPANDGALLGPLQNLWFWSTRDRADRVSRGGEVNKLLYSLNAQLGYLNPIRQAKDGMLVTIGHSFGARIVFESIQQTIADNVIREGRGNIGESCSGNVVCHTVTGFGEIVILLNPAFEAAQYNTFFRFSGGSWLNTIPDSGGGQLRLRNLEIWPQMQPPLILSIGATNDEATTRPWKVAHPLTDPALHTTLTNYLPYITHELHFDSNGNETRITDNADILDRTRTFGPLNGVTLIPQEKSNNSPFIVARADPQIVNGHSGIWTHTLRKFLDEYLQQLEAVKRVATQGVY